MLSEDSKIVSNPNTCAVIFNTFFTDVIKELDIDRSLHTDTTIDSDDSVEMATKKFKSHPSVLRIRHKGYFDNNSSFDPFSECDIPCIINKIDPSKAYHTGNIPKCSKG